MKTLQVKQVLQANQKALFTAKGHNKATIKACIKMLQALPLDYEIEVRNNTATPTNAGDVAEVFAGYMLGYEKHAVSISGNDLPTTYKNEVKLCYSNNRPSNDISDKGHYMVDMLSGKPRLTWVSRSVVRACKDYLIKGNRGGNTYAEAVINYIG
jgi:hypothetical protein